MQPVFARGCQATTHNTCTPPSLSIPQEPTHTKGISARHERSNILSPEDICPFFRVTLISAFRETVPQAALSLALLHPPHVTTQNCFLLQGTSCYVLFK